MRRFVTAVVPVMCILVLISCGKRFVGEQIEYPAEAWCEYYPGYYPAFGEGKHCVLTTAHLIFDFIIKKGDAEGDFVIQGFIDATQGNLKSFNYIIEGRSRFFMLVGKVDKIVDNVSFRPKTLWSDLQNKMPFRIDYHSDEGFDKVTFGYDLSISG